MATGNMHKNIREDRPISFQVIRADRETDRQTYSSQYFATLPGGEVITQEYKANTSTHTLGCLFIGNLSALRFPVDL